MRQNAWCYAHKNIILPIMHCVCFRNTRSDRCWKNNNKKSRLWLISLQMRDIFLCVHAYIIFHCSEWRLPVVSPKEKFLFSNSTSSVVLCHINACYRTKQLCVSSQGLEKVYYLPRSWMLHETQLSVLSPPRAGSVWQKLQSFPKLVNLLQFTAEKWQKSQHNIFLCLPHSTHFHKTTMMFLAIDR